MIKYYVLIAFSSLLLIGLSFYFLSEKYSIGDNFPETSIYRSDAKGESVIFETLSSIESKHVATYEDPLKSLLKYNESLFIFNTNILYKSKKLDDLASHIHEGNHLLIVKGNFNKYNQEDESEDSAQEDKENAENDEKEDVEKNGKDNNTSKKNKEYKLDKKAILKKGLSEKAEMLSRSLADNLLELG
jgi:hypothetical protein